MPLGGKDQSAKNASFQVRTERYPFDGRTTHNVEDAETQQAPHDRTKAWMERPPMLYPRHRSAAETLGSSTRTEASPHGGASSLRWMRKCQAHRSLPRDLLSSAPNTSLRKARPVVAQGGLSALHSLFVIIRARRRTNHQTLHSLSRPDPIHHQPTNRLPEPASHSCPRQRKTDQAKTPRQDFPRQTLPISALPG